jgi:hypothetical protein
MNSINILLNQNIPFPVNWYISTPSLYGTNKLWDIVGGQSAAFVNPTTQTVWKGFNDKPGALAGCVSTRAATSGGEIDILLTRYTDFTIMGWAKIASYGTAGMLFSTTYSSLRCNSSFPGTINVNAGTASTLTFTNEIWTHFALTVGNATGSTQKGYINGKYACSYTSIAGGGGCVIRSVGNQQDSPSSSKQTKGDFDDIMIFDKILTEEQIRKIYLSSFYRKSYISQYLSEVSSSSAIIQSYILSLMGGQF